MLEKFGPIKNPLTIIAIFAGIAEVSGTAILPFIDINNQNIFIGFLIVFPSILVILFFLTLNFNHKVLYAPSDYKNEENFVKTLKFDYNKLELKETKESKQQIMEKTKYEISISNFEDAERLINIYKSQNFLANLYIGIGEGEDPGNNSIQSEHEAIWLGANVSVGVAVPVIKIAKKFYPHLKYIHLSSNIDGSPDYIHDQIFIGGATSAAKRLHLHQISKEDFNKLNEKMSQEDFHSFIKKIS
ncbi:hypothetical protein ACFL3C_00230 [Patescibacteria group bacterium]